MATFYKWKAKYGGLDVFDGSLDVGAFGSMQLVVNAVLLFWCFNDGQRAGDNDLKTLFTHKRGDDV
ncbi:hypothetical protein So717_37020 [Roseobacter cerasinus]|uniref:Uncharacterized protein n=1 Tax=Roseobacter cerasinus TaxID=2602289 RepID=A0A640VVA4_9RHOB|nr:hypothetical protein So717_37020 [Roseobacter cerasinus]